VAFVSAINEDSKSKSRGLPNAEDEWVKIRGKRIFGQFNVVQEGDDYRMAVKTKSNKSSKRRFKKLTAKFGRESIVHAANGLHPDTSDAPEQYQDQSCHEGAAHWDIEAQRTMDC
jgi:hypothetical protein